MSQEPTVAHVWWARPAEVAQTLLSPIEREKAARLRNLAERGRSLTAALLLRAVLAERTGIAPGELVIDRRCADCGGPHGRPRLTGSGLEVSVTHSGDLVGVALTAGVPVGLDAESASAPVTEGMAGLACTPAELRWLLGYPQPRQQDAFLRLWTAKEAVLKALGTGLMKPMTELDLEPPAADGPFIGPVREGATAWLYPVSPGPDYLGSLAGLAPLDGIEEHDGDALLRTLG